MPVRIVHNGNYNASRGRLEVWVNGTWSAVFDDAPGAMAGVACRMLGYKKGGSEPSFEKRVPGLKMLIEWINCNGNENNIFDCEFIWSHDDSLGKQYTHPYACVECKS